ncbi:MAG: TlpA family protein disulfide reductase [Hyphomicrobiaceae bacterium]|nr:TlpA family protein disulfide reductase [Hyphomicrobiaceae bacterium]
MMQRFSGFAAAAVLALCTVTAAYAADIRAFGKGMWASIIEEHKGKPLIVHLWGVTCAPCREELPEWGRLVQDKPPIDIVIVHAERLPPNPNTMHNMLEYSGLGEIRTWAFADAPVGTLIREIDPNWRGELPVTMLISRTGFAKLAIGRADMSEVRGWIAAQMLVQK